MPRAVLLDFYGTLARDTHPTPGIDQVLGTRGYEISDRQREQWWNGDLDGLEHVEVSRSRDHYRAWQRERLVALLTEADVHPGEHDAILAELDSGRATRVLRAYPEVPAALSALRAAGLTLAVCSNWDWDLEAAVAEAGLAGCVDMLVSSAWAGARKPHARIFRYTLDALEVAADEVVFVGDTWGPDVEGPTDAGMRAVYLERDGHWPDATLPDEGVGPRDVARVKDLSELLGVL
ncbi:MAG TPA: HAD family hydrolase [Acidimicrobiia bacterium]|jgi:putative hydrolase of the HAD superfamily